MERNNNDIICSGVKTLTYDQNLNDVVSFLGYFRKCIMIRGINTAVISTVMKTSAGYGEQGVTLILFLGAILDSAPIY